MQIVQFGPEKDNVQKIPSLCFLTAENHVEVVDSNHVNHQTTHLLIHHYKTNSISGHNLEKQIVHGKQYSDIFANNFGNFPLL